MRMKRVAAAAAAAGLVVSLAGCFPDGFWQVGNGPGQVKPGLYVSNAIPLGQHCNLTLYQANQFGAFPQVAQEEVGGRNFFEVPPILHGYVSSTGCGLWSTPKPTSYNPDRTTARYGVYRVPTDLMPGTYTAPGAPGCSWQVYKSFAPRPSSIDQSGQYVPGTRPKVTITQQDVGFDTQPCGGWKRVGT